jgi:signal transduction histidine kinase
MQDSRQSRRLATNLRLIVPLAILLFVILLAQSILEYRAGRKAAVDLLSNQAETLIHSVSTAAEKGLLAYESQQTRITAHLYTIGEMIERLSAIREVGRRELDEILQSNDLVLLQLVDNNCMPILTATSYRHPLDELLVTAIKCEDFDPERPRAFVGFVNLGPDIHLFATVTIFPDKRAVIAGVDAEELLLMRRAFGAGSLIEALSQSPGLKYTAILEGISVLAASRNFPSGSMDNWYYSGSPADSTVTTRIKRVSDSGNDIFEVLSPFYIGNQPSGQIVVGLDTAYLDQLTSQLRKDIIWRSGLFLFVAILLISGILIRQNYRILSNEYKVMQEDVRRLEADRALSAKLAAMGELASGVAHEIRNPLNAISVIIQRLKREFEPKCDDAEYRELTGIIQKETDRINESVKQFLTLARPPVLNRTEANLNDCVAHAASLFRPRAEAQKCRLKVATGDMPQLNFDPELCGQALLNLLENALAAVDSNGLISMNTYRRGKACFLEIADNGSGIPDFNKERVFDLYYTTRPTGTGMGLPNVLRIVKEHGGRVEVIDNPGGGTIFRLEFPIE